MDRQELTLLNMETIAVHIAVIVTQSSFTHAALNNTLTPAAVKIVCASCNCRWSLKCTTPLMNFYQGSEANNTFKVSHPGLGTNKQLKSGTVPEDPRRLAPMLLHPPELCPTIIVFFNLGSFLLMQDYIKVLFLFGLSTS